MGMTVVAAAALAGELAAGALVAAVDTSLVFLPSLPLLAGRTLWFEPFAWAGGFAGTDAEGALAGAGVGVVLIEGAEAACGFVAPLEPIRKYAPTASAMAITPPPAASSTLRLGPVAG